MSPERVRRPGELDLGANLADNRAITTSGAHGRPGPLQATV